MPGPIRAGHIPYEFIVCGSLSMALWQPERLSPLSSPSHLPDVLICGTLLNLQEIAHVVIPHHHLVRHHTFLWVQPCHYCSEWCYLVYFFHRRSPQLA